MHELEKIAGAVELIVREGGGGLLVTVAGTRGSTYRRAGARCVIARSGGVTGAISGGCVERDLAERARAWGDDLTARIVTYDSSSADDIVFGLGLGCRGEIEMLVQPFDAEHRPRLPQIPGRAILVAATVIASENPRFKPGEAYEYRGEADRTRRVVEDGCDLLVEVIEPQRAVIIFGGGADAEPVAALAEAVGWRAEIITARTCHPSEVRTKVDLTAFDAAVIMTHNFLHDVTLLESVLASPIPYAGVLGPKSRGEELLTQIGNITPEMRARIHNPIGLDLGGETAEEIALAIVAEIQAALNERRAERLRDRSGPIHEPATAGRKTCV